jgi:hypothetical protein
MLRLVKGKEKPNVDEKSQNKIISNEDLMNGHIRF